MTSRGKHVCQNNQLDPRSRFDTIPGLSAYDRQTDEHIPIANTYASTWRRMDKNSQAFKAKLVPYVWVFYKYFSN